MSFLASETWRLTLGVSRRRSWREFVIRTGDKRSFNGPLENGTRLSTSNMPHFVVRQTRLVIIIATLLFGLSNGVLQHSVLAQTSGGDQDKRSVSVTSIKLAPGDPVQITLDTSPSPGRFAVMLNDTDITGLVEADGSMLRYKPGVFPIPPGDSKVRLYLIDANSGWSLAQEIALTISNQGAASSPRSVEFTPSLSINIKGERNLNFFPASARPERPGYTDTAGQAGLQLKVTSNGWTVAGQFDFAGSTRISEALRFGELGNRAPSVDLSSYRVEVSKGRFKTSLGHVSFGAQRYLVNSFSSRGLSVTVPIGKQNELTFAAMNGTSIVGFDNFAGLSRADHQVYGATFAREFMKERPGGLRLEVTAMGGSLLPLNSFNKRTINDAEKSFGGSVRLQFKTKDERLRFEGGFTRSRFTNRADPSLEQGVQLTRIVPVSRSARFLEASYDIIQGLKLFDDRKLKVTGTFRHEEVEPLFKSVAASSQADKRQNQFEVTASFGDVSFIYGNLRDRDNLLDLASVLETLNRRNNFSLAFSAGTLFSPKKPIKYLPRIAYSFDHVHQFGAFLPTGGLFNSLSQVPNQANAAHSLGVDIPISEKLKIGYRYSRAFQDNRQPGRERSDLLSTVNSATLSISYFKDIEIGLDLSGESQRNFESSKIDKKLRIGTNLTWQNALIKNSAFALNASADISGDKANTSDNENYELAAQWSYRLAFGKKTYRKVSAQFFLRYANRYGDQTNRTFSLRSITRNQGFSTGLTFTFF